VKEHVAGPVDAACFAVAGPVFADRAEQIIERRIRMTLVSLLGKDGAPRLRSIDKLEQNLRPTDVPGYDFHVGSFAQAQTRT